MELIFSEDFQTSIAEAGWVPGNFDYADAITGFAAEAAMAAVENSTLTPNSPEWGVVDGAGVLTEFWTRIASGEDVATVAADTDAALQTALND